jgi:uncharacterized protein YodC (DUF2158 family)
MDNEEIKVGDVVKLKSGGLKMTIATIDGKDIYCKWFDKDTTLKDGYFVKEMLEKLIKKG